MENCWTLHVKGLGKLSEVNVTVAPLTLFVGDNNSGKSYLMGLLYTLLNIRFYAHGYDLCLKSEEYGECASLVLEKLESCRQGRKIVWEMDGTAQESFARLLNKVLRKNIKRIARRTFNTDIPIGKISIEFPRHEVRRRIILTCRKEGEEENRIYIVRPDGYNSGRAREAESLQEMAFFVGFLLEYMLKQGFKRNSMADANYLPSSRTGFLLAYKPLIGASLADAYDSGKEAGFQGKLTRPCSDFLKNLAQLSQEGATQTFRPVVEFIEQRMVCGRVGLHGDTPQPSILYRSETAGIELPMHLASGVVTELAPLLLLLQYQPDIHAIFMEEPETGLHPKLQLLMAQVIIRILNMGIPMFVTTHSDNILQHINNMIKLSNQPTARKKKLLEKYGYDGKMDLLSGKDVSMYQFDVGEGDGHSVVQPLTYNSYGFEVPTFNGTFRELLRESRAFESDGDEDDE